ncbi:hypothetical protein BDV26DRAFT_289099 [Aspergillus bertholletiae]|uniref:Rhodopsin domain-containing protein n=1 Tax=Aspergillus bertholletiae TaxID=1226010 RepID=A0A5N7BJJ1_9EURO|nr:hypothetical protein BDV26DRAFT_289099 [Aspergillus bertholletiae]
MTAALPPDVDRAPNLLICFWVPFPFTVALVGTRFYCRGARKQLGYDDWTILLAWMLYTAAAAMSTSMLLRGGARHTVHIDPANIRFVFKMQILNQVPAALSAMLGKISVALFIMRISGRTSKWRRWFLIIHITLYTLLTIINLCILLGQCRPIQALWDQSVRQSGQAKCLDPSIDTDVTMFQSSFGAYLDFVLALLPLTFIMELNVGLRKRIILCLILGLGIVAGICACIKTSKFNAAANPTDPTWNSYSLYLWAFLEIPLVIIAACIPPSKPIWDFLVKGQPIRTSSDSSYTAGSTGSYRIGFVKTSVHARSKTSERVVEDGELLLNGKGAAQNIRQTVHITQTSRERQPMQQSGMTRFEPGDLA